MEKSTCTNCGKDNKVYAKYCSDCGYELPKFKIENKEQPIQQNNADKTDKRKRLIGLIVGSVAFALSSIVVQQV